jgi:hypothetical protein
MSPSSVIVAGVFAERSVKAVLPCKRDFGPAAHL